MPFLIFHNVFEQITIFLNFVGYIININDIKWHNDEKHERKVNAFQTNNTTKEKIDCRENTVTVVFKSQLSKKNTDGNVENAYSNVN